MPGTRIYQPVSLAVKQTLRLDDQAGHHLARVLRASVGDELTLFNGQGGEYEAVIVRIDKKGVDVEIKAFNPREVESPVQIHLAQGIARGEKMDFIVQKAVELGVASIIPLVTERCNVKLMGDREEKRREHWQAVANSACEQSGRNRVPMVSALENYHKWLPTAKFDYSFVLSPHVKQKLIVDKMPTNASILLLIGPEGGLSDQEVDAAVKHGFLPLNLGPRVLRTETAAIAAMAALQSKYGDFA